MAPICVNPHATTAALPVHQQVCQQVTRTVPPDATRVSHIQPRIYYGYTTTDLTEVRSPGSGAEPCQVPQGTAQQLCRNCVQAWVGSKRNFADFGANVRNDTSTAIFLGRGKCAKSPLMSVKYAKLRCARARSPLTLAVAEACPEVCKAVHQHHRRRA